MLSCHVVCTFAVSQVHLQQYQHAKGTLVEVTWAQPCRVLCSCMWASITSSNLLSLVAEYEPAAEPLELAAIMPLEEANHEAEKEQARLERKWHRAAPHHLAWVDTALSPPRVVPQAAQLSTVKTNTFAPSQVRPAGHACSRVCRGRRGHLLSAPQHVLQAAQLSSITVDLSRCTKCAYVMQHIWCAGVYCGRVPGLRRHCSSHRCGCASAAPLLRPCCLHRCLSS